MKTKLTVFLGGTCGDSTWRNKIIGNKNLNDNIELFNPVVSDWTSECQEIEDEHKQKDNVILFVITPAAKGVYSASEMTRSSILHPSKTVACLLKEENDKTFEKHELKSWEKVFEDLNKDGAFICNSIEDIITLLNKLSNVLE